jgi:hypothetical protein
MIEFSPCKIRDSAASDTQEVDFELHMQQLAYL